MQQLVLFHTRRSLSVFSNYGGLVARFDKTQFAPGPGLAAQVALERESRGWLRKIVGDDWARAACSDPIASDFLPWPTPTFQRISSASVSGGRGQDFLPHWENLDYSQSRRAGYRVDGLRERKFRPGGKRAGRSARRIPDFARVFLRELSGGSPTRPKAHQQGWCSLHVRLRL